MKAVDPKEKKQPAKRLVSGKLFDSVFLPWMAVLIVLHLLSMYVAPACMWGVHFYRFYPAWIGWILVLASLAILIPGVGDWLYPKFEALAKKVVGIGSCACTGMPSAQRNFFPKQTKDEIQYLVDRFVGSDEVKKLEDVIEVDYKVPGCPMNPDNFLKVLNQALSDLGAA